MENIKEQNLPLYDPNPEQVVEQYRNMDTKDLTGHARRVCERYHGKSVYLRGLLEISNFCGQNCLYCGIRSGNTKVERYRLTDNEIMEAVDAGYKRGIKTFVLQAGEDPEFRGSRMERLIETIKQHTDGRAAVTLSLGILPKERYAAFKKAGADRYLLRFETSDPQIHSYLRNGVTLKERIKALETLKELDYETGTGYMVGLPGETEEIRVQNALLTRRLEADMVGLGPFIPHPDTPLAQSEQKPFELTLRATALVRLLLPGAHIPATTATGSLVEDGREQVIQAGANVLMPNLTPVARKKDYLLYPGKICLDEGGISCVGCLQGRVMSVDRVLSFDKGTSLRFVQPLVQ